MRRKDREMDSDFAYGVLERCDFATLAMTLEDGSPYCIPISPVLIDGDVYFHCAHRGLKADAMRANPSVCVSAACDVVPIPEEFATRYSSAVAFGRAAEVTDKDEKISVLRAICERYAASNMAGFDKEIERFFSRTSIWRVNVESITGKCKKATD